jgi:hypothetical protein
MYDLKSNSRYFLMLENFPVVIIQRHKNMERSGKGNLSYLLEGKLARNNVLIAQIITTIALPD